MHPSKHIFKAWLSTFTVMLVIDALWLGVVAKDLYQQAAHPRWAAAASFYLAYPVGLVIFAVRPALAAHSVGRAVLLGGLFGLFAYGTYDLTNLAVVQDWPLRLTFIDLAWGSFASAVSAGAGMALTRWWAGRWALVFCSSSSSSSSSRVVTENAPAAGARPCPVGCCPARGS